MKPVLSIVATSRNDNHGGDLTKRMRLFVKGMLYQCNKFKYPVELVIVEWNPPTDKPFLKDVLPQPAAGDYLTLKYIVVPSEVHKGYVHHATIPLFQMIAKNVGIRRATAPFILSTNIDLLFSDDLMLWLKNNTFKKGHFYRASRADVSSDIPENEPVEQLLDWCKGHVIRHWTYFSRMNKSRTIKLLLKVPGMDRILEKLVNRLNTYNMSPYAVMSWLDYYACGDFTLMHHDDWMTIEGYAELDLYSIHVDSMALNACAAKGIKQIIIPSNACTYHIDHYDGWAAMSTMEMLHFLAKRPGLDWNIVYHAGADIIEKKGSYGLNKPDWGFANHNFEEFTFNSENLD